MTAREFRERLARRAKRAQVAVPDDLLGQLHSYFLLLSRWNLKINLTALPLDPPTDETFDRLLIEPLVAARYIGESVERWVDVGSGGGSPAIPLKIACPMPNLTMVESKTRKAAFLREAIRSIPLESASVENRRFEELIDSPGLGGAVDLITVRAVRPDAVLTTTAKTLLSHQGRLFLFRSSEPAQDVRSFHLATTVQLCQGGSAFLGIYEPNVPRGTNS